jgi:hypothetical protein
MTNSPSRNTIGSRSQAAAHCGVPYLRQIVTFGERRTLARGHLQAHAWNGHLLTARLTPLGRRLATRRHVVCTRVRLAGSYGDARVLRWTIRLKVPRGRTGVSW